MPLADALAGPSLDAAADLPGGAARIAFRLARREGVTVTLHDTSGHPLARVFSGTPPAGTLIEAAVPPDALTDGDHVVWLQTASGESRHVRFHRSPHRPV